MSQSSLASCPTNTSVPVLKSLYVWPDCASGESSGARLNWTFFTAPVSSPFTTCTGLGVVVLFDSYDDSDIFKNIGCIV